MRLSNIQRLLAVVVSFGLAAPLSASVVNVQYTGTVSSGYDMTGIFGTPASFLDGAAFTVNFSFETNNGTYGAPQPGYNYVHGGVAFGTSSPVLSATIAVNAHVFEVLGDWYGYLIGRDQPFSEAGHGAYESNTVGVDVREVGLYASIFSPVGGLLPYSLTDPFSYSVAVGDTSRGAFRVLDRIAGSTLRDTHLELIPEHLTITTAVPEPETYAMLLAGLGLLGYAARRRKQKEAAAA